MDGWVGGQMVSWVKDCLQQSKMLSLTPVLPASSGSSPQQGSRPHVQVHKVHSPRNGIASYKGILKRGFMDGGKK